MRRADLLIGIALLILSAFYYQASFQIVRGFASDLLGPTFFPRLLAAALAVLATTLIVRAASGRSDPAPLPAIRVRLFWSTLGLTLAYVLLLPRLGFLIATPLLLGAVIWLLGLRRWATLAGAAVGFTLALYLVFARALHVLLPLGPLGSR